MLRKVITMIPHARIQVFRLALLTTSLLLFYTAQAPAQDEPKQPEFKAPALTPPSVKLPAIFAKGTPESVADLKAIQDHVDKLVEKVIPTVVSVRIGASFGSGVIVSKDGYILTAGHVSGKPDRDVVVYFHNGKTAKGKTLGGNHGIDSGLIKITDPGDYAFADMGDSASLKSGAWCMVIAHPGGYKQGRAPVVRLGRTLKTSATTLTTDCALVGGDSGGPLFDMHGRVVGINSRIGQSLTANLHVPVNPYRESWDRLAKAEVFGGKLGAPSKDSPWIGVQLDPDAKGCVIAGVTPGSPAEKAGMMVNDHVRKFDDRAVTEGPDLVKLVQARKAGDAVVLEVVRGGEVLSLRVQIGKR
jgi:serine protease Do